MKTIALIPLIFLLKTCSPEKFDKIDPAEFNRQIVNRTDIHSAEQLVIIYYNFPENEGTPEFAISDTTLENNIIEVTLIHDRQKDDSQRATKVILTAKQDNGRWEVLEIKTNRMCYKGRGHTSWGTEPCI